MDLLIHFSNPENRRSTLFQEALWKIHGDKIKYINISYHEIFSHHFDIYWKDINDGTSEYNHIFIRIDSSGENTEVTAHLLKLGYISTTEDIPLIDPHTIDNEGLEEGRLYYMHQEYIGYKTLITQIHQKLIDKFGHFHYLNHVSDISILFDKIKTKEVLIENNLPTPKLIPVPNDYDSLVNFLMDNNIHKIFIKPRFSSSACGVCAFHIGDRTRQVIYTSMRIIRNNGTYKMINQLRINRYENLDDISLLINYIISDGCVVEEWINKDTINNNPYDLRIVTINYKATHVVVREGTKGLITNLHLGNQRGDLGAIKKRLGERTWAKILNITERAAKAFKDSLYIGWDVLISYDKDIFIIEGNCFGDLLPRIVYDGLSTYEYECSQLYDFINR